MRKANFTDFEYCEMELSYGEFQRSATHVAYAVHFPIGPYPNVVSSQM